MRKIIIGTRGSRLALIQAESVAGRLRDLFPSLEFEIRKIVTGGDRNPHIRLDRMDTIGVFVKELEEALLDGRIDLAVHSLKDMPTIIPESLGLTAVLARQDPRDVLVTRGQSLDSLPPGSRIGTGSLRRSLQLTWCRPDLEVLSIRGNVGTRLRKVADGEVDGVILAAAALQRMGLQDNVTQYLPVEDFLPSAGQGAIALEIRRDDDTAGELSARINHVPTWQCVSAERAFLSTLGGGCRAPIAALATLPEGRLKIDGLAASADGSRVLRGSGEGNPSSAEPVGAALANELLARGAGEFIEGAKENETR